MKLQSTNDLEAEMRAVAREEIVAPADAALPSMESPRAIVAHDHQQSRRLSERDSILVRALLENPPAASQRLIEAAKKGFTLECPLQASVTCSDVTD